jgi:hypothetical protein
LKIGTTVWYGSVRTVPYRNDSFEMHVQCSYANARHSDVEIEDTTVEVVVAECSLLMVFVDVECKNNSSKR